MSAGAHHRDGSFGVEGSWQRDEHSVDIVAFHQFRPVGNRARVRDPMLRTTQGRRVRVGNRRDAKSCDTEAVRQVDADR
jgi:hypothetical protein